MSYRTLHPLPLEARNIALVHGERRLLEEINLEIHQGEFFAIMALGGAGKSLLFRILIGLQQPTSGQVFWFGNDITSVPEREKQELRRSIGAAYQHGALFADLTVEENIAFALTELSDHDPQHIKSTVEFTLEAAGLMAHRHSHPTSLPAVIVRKAALARAIILGPKLLICDDIFSGLDPKAQQQVDGYLRGMHILRSMATVIMTHNLAVALDLADRIAILENGRINVTGSPKEIVADSLPEILSQFKENSVSR